MIQGGASNSVNAGLGIALHVSRGEGGMPPGRLRGRRFFLAASMCSMAGSEASSGPVWQPPMSHHTACPSAA